MNHVFTASVSTAKSFLGLCVMMAMHPALQAVYRPVTLGVQNANSVTP